MKRKNWYSTKQARKLKSLFKANAQIRAISELKKYSLETHSDEPFIEQLASGRLKR